MQFKLDFAGQYLGTITVDDDCDKTMAQIKSRVESLFLSAIADLEPRHGPYGFGIEVAEVTSLVTTATLEE